MHDEVKGCHDTVAALVSAERFWSVSRSSQKDFSTFRFYRERGSVCGCGDENILPVGFFCWHFSCEPVCSDIVCRNPVALAQEYNALKTLDNTDPTQGSPQEVWPSLAIDAAPILLLVPDHTGRN